MKQKIKCNNKKAVIFLILIALIASYATLVVAKAKLRYTWTSTEKNYGFGGSGEQDEYYFRCWAVDGVYVACTRVDPMTNYINVTFRYDSTTLGPYKLTQGDQTPVITDLNGEDVIVTIIGIDHSIVNQYDVTVKIYEGRT